MLILMIAGCGKHKKRLIYGTSCLKNIGLSALMYKKRTGKDAYNLAKDFKAYVILIALNNEKSLFPKDFKYVLVKNAPFGLQDKYGATPQVILFIDSNVLVLYDQGFVKKIEEADKVEKNKKSNEVAAPNGETADANSP